MKKKNKTMGGRFPIALFFLTAGTVVRLKQRGTVVVPQGFNRTKAHMFPTFVAQCC